MGYPREVVVAIDGSEPAQRALEIAIQLVLGSSGGLCIASVVPRFAVYSRAEHAMRGWVSPETRRAVGRLLTEAADRARTAGVGRVRRVERVGDPVDELLALLDEVEPDLLVLGARGLSGARRVLLGSVSDALVHSARVPTLVVRGPVPHLGAAPGARARGSGPPGRSGAGP